MNLSKSYEFFRPENVDGRIHIVGCGSVGSVLAENLARCGITKMTLWDFDTVEEKNVVNQLYTQKDIGMLKVDALSEHLKEINPDIEVDIVKKPEGWNGQMMAGYVFLAVDNIEIRKEIVEKHLNNLYVKAMFDFRTMLKEAQHYAADWSNIKAKTDFLNSMKFSHEEAKAETPLSACGETLGVATTVRIICALGVNNFINFVNEGKIKKLIIANCFDFIVDAF